MRLMFDVEVLGPSERETLRDVRLAAGLTQGGLAEAVGVGERTVRFWESGEVEVRTGRIVPLARALRESPARMLEVLAATQARRWR